MFFFRSLRSSFLSSWPLSPGNPVRSRTISRCGSNLQTKTSLEVHLSTNTNGMPSKLKCCHRELRIGGDGHPTTYYREFYVKGNIWWFPKIGVPPNHPFLDGIVHHEPSILGFPHDYGNSHIWVNTNHENYALQTTDFFLGGNSIGNHAVLPMKYARFL